MIFNGECQTCVQTAHPHLAWTKQSYKLANFPADKVTRHIWFTNSCTVLQTWKVLVALQFSLVCCVLMQSWKGRHTTWLIFSAFSWLDYVCDCKSARTVFKSLQVSECTKGSDGKLVVYLKPQGNQPMPDIHHFKWVELHFAFPQAFTILVAGVVWRNIWVEMISADNNVWLKVHAKGIQYMAHYHLYDSLKVKTEHRPVHIFLQLIL